MPLTLEVIKGEFAVCQLKTIEKLPKMTKKGGVYSLTVTEDEVSLVCALDDVPKDASKTEAGWSVLKVVGPLEFSMTGVLAGLSHCLAEAEISIFVISTFDTDYILVKQGVLAQSIEVLAAAGYRVK